MAPLRPPLRGIARLRPTPGDSGMTLIELMMALLVFGLAATGITAGFITAMKTARSDQNRVAAANPAARELEIVRNTFRISGTQALAIAGTPLVVNPNPLPGGTAGQPLILDNAEYTVTRTTQWLPAGSGASACDGGVAVTYPSLAVQVEVTWPNMNGVEPVRSNTVLTPPKGVLAGGTSFIAVKVLDRDGLPVVGMPVTLTKSPSTVNGVTADDGCATMAVPSAGAWTATLSETGWVDFFGLATATKAVTVASGGLAQTTMSYDEAATVRVTYQTAAGYALPTGLSRLTLSNAQIQPSGLKTVNTSSSTTTIPGLWPFADGYTMWAGACLQSDPATAGGIRDTAVVIDPGATELTTTALAPVGVLVRNAASVPLANATVVAYPLDASGCAATENPLSLGVTNASGVLQTSLPAGDWRLQVTGRSPSGAWPTTGTLLPDDLPISKVVTVS